MVTSPVCHPLEKVPVRTGGVLSMLMPFTDAALLVLSALSTAAPLADWPRPSPDFVTPSGHVLTPESASLHVKVTVTSVLFQPFAFGAGARAAVIFGSVLSSFTTTESVATLFALSVAVAATNVPPVSPLTAFDADDVPSTTHDFTPVPPGLSWQEKVTVTLALSQPAALGAGATRCEIEGAMASVIGAVEL